MKRYLVLLFACAGLALTLSSAAQIRKIPADVTDAFKTRYPHAEKVEWKDKISSFEAGFILNGFEMTANFSSRGDWERSEKKANFADLPEAVKAGFEKSKYTGWEKTAAVEIDEISKPLFYRVLIKKSGVQKKYLFFDNNGRLNREAVTL